MEFSGLTNEHGRQCDQQHTDNEICNLNLGGDLFPKTRAKIEPDAGTRQMARAQLEWFTALVDEGFSETQALTIIGTSLGVAIANSNLPSEG